MAATPTQRNTELSDEAFSTALSLRLRLPVLDPMGQCNNTLGPTEWRQGRRNQRVCSKALGDYADHPFACSRGEITRRHNSVRDAWRQAYREAGNAAQPDPLVYEMAPRNGKETYADLK
eukprot:4787711-Prorocentrum_lima.AAC.1